VICPTCEFESRDGAKFCRMCGTPLSLRCPACGAAHDPAQRFCEECGAALAITGTAGVDAPAAPPAPTPAAVTELRQVSVLFVDLVGFTPLSEARAAEDVRELLARYFDTARTIVRRHGGVIGKFVGDAVMAVWGVPQAREDDAERATRAALALVEAVAAFGEEVGAPGLRARGGVTTGKAAPLQSPGEGLVAGDRVNTASRIQTVAESGSVLVDAVTRQLAGAAIAFEDAGEHLMKGKSESLRLWRAVRVTGGIRGSDAEPGMQSPFVGRDGDLWLIKELFHGALDRRSARLVAVSGEAGVGKTRLRREFFNYVDGLSETVLWHAGRCLSFGDGVAYWALTEMVRQRLGIAEDASPEEAVAKLEEGIERWVDNPIDRAFLRPRLGALLALEDPGLPRDELFAGWRLFFQRLSEHLPVVLVFEDLQWADRGLREFIEQLLDRSSACPIFILTLSRADMSLPQEPWPAPRLGAMALGLKPLAEADMRALLTALVDGLPEPAADRIMERAQGVPLYAIEILRALTDRGVLAERDGHLVLQGELGELHVPASLSSLLAARLDALEAPERELVKAMSVFGSSFPRAAAAALGGVEESQLDAVLASLVRSQVFVIRADRLSPQRGQFAFAQGMLRTVAYEMLTRRERVLRHVAAAEYLSEVYATDSDDVTEMLAAHYVSAHRAAGADPEAPELRAKAVVALRRAARRAATVGAPEVAEGSYRTAAALADGEAERAELTQAAGEMALQSGRYADALELLEVACQAHLQAGRTRQAAQVTGDIGLALGRLGRLQEAVDRFTAALELLDTEGPDAVTATLNVRLGHALVFLGEHDRAEGPLEAALSIAETLDLPTVLSDALNQKAILYVLTGRVQQALHLWTAVVGIAEERGLGRELSLARTNLGALAGLWDLPDAEEQTKAALAVARRRGDRAAESFNASNLMMIWLRTGRWAAIEALAGELLEDPDRPGAEPLHFALALLHVLRGNPVAARQELDQMPVWERTEAAELRAAYRMVEMHVMAAEGQPEQAVEVGLELIPQAVATLGASAESVRTGWPEAVRLALHTRRVDDAVALVTVLTDHPSADIPRFLATHLTRARALVDAARGGHSIVEAELTDAIERFRALPAPYWTAVTQTDLAGWLIERGRADEASGLLDEAVATLQPLGAAPALGRVRDLKPAPSEDPAPATDALPG
jgi:class 3 adenylate cyclase/tetratricopeptide (TPR) repeat protein